MIFRPKFVTRILFKLLFLVLFWGILPDTAAASASLYLFPPSGTYAVGDKFNVSVKVDPGDTGINAAESVLIFNPSELEVVSVSKTASFFTLWTKEPEFSNIGGRIDFGGGTQKPFTSSVGTIVTISFKAKVSATTQVNFSSGSVLAADGLGTNVLGTMQGGSYTFNTKNVAVALDNSPTPVKNTLPVDTGVTAAPNTPEAPVIFSATHPDPDTWYSANNVSLSWSLPENISRIRSSINHDLVSLPNIDYKAGTLNADFEKIEDGIWYFHLQFKNAAGWGSIAHRKILIDTAPPLSFEIKVENAGDPAQPTPKLVFKAADELSGISYYEIKIDLTDSVKKMPDELESDSYQVQKLAPGKHSAIIRAVDMAGNSTLSLAEFEIISMSCPVPIVAPESIGTGDPIVFKGSSDYPGSTVSASIFRDESVIGTKEAGTDSHGNWAIFFPEDLKLKAGNYKARIKIFDSQGGQSEACPDIDFAIESSLINKIYLMVVDYLGIISLALILIIFNVWIFVFAWHKIVQWRDRVKREADEADQTTLEAFEWLKKQNENEIKYLNSLPEISEREKNLQNRLKYSLNNAENKIRKEIEDIENEL
jgi:hypothetical protein